MTTVLSNPEMLPLGVDGILVRFSRSLSEQANASALAFRERIAAAQITGVTEVASSLVSVRVGFDPEATTRASVLSALREHTAEGQSTDDSPKRIWRIPTAFGPAHAPQLAEAAALAGISPEQAIADLTGTTVRVIAIGFAPGQPYLGMLPPAWDIPRQTTLTQNLPQGALICAVRQLILWAAAAPTGWRHIGQTAFRVYRPETTKPFAFAPGDAVQFHAVSDTDFAAITANKDTNGGAVCEVLR